ncbi:unnamed protein product, partial [Meganyctiphanes norvegica]
MSKVLDQRSFVGSHVGSSSSSTSIADLPHQNNLGPVGLSLLDHHNTSPLKMGITNDIAKSLPPDTTIALGGDNPPKKESGPEPIKQSLLVHIASLILYGCQALPIRLKILLDRLLSLLNHDEVMQLLSGFSWTYEDYERGYKLQDRSGQVLHSWHMMSPEEESLVLRQFLRFSETKDVAQQLLKQQPGQREPSRDTTSEPKDSNREPLSVRSDLQTPRDTIKDSLNLSPRQSESRSIARETSDSLRETLRLRDSRELVDESRKPERSYMDHSSEPKLHVKDSSELFRDSKDPLRELIRQDAESRNRNLFRDSRESTREPREPLRELREPLRDSKEPTKDYYGNQTPNFPRGQPPSYNATEAMKALNPEIKKFLERTNMLFNPFMQGGSGDLLRPPPSSSHLGLPAAPPQISPANLATNFLGAAQSSLATSLLMNQQLSSMLRLPAPPVSLSNLSQSTITPSISSSTSPGIGVTPLNHLQNLQPFDFRKSSHSPKSASSGPHSGVGAADFAGDIGRPAFSTGSGITGLPPTSRQHSPPAPPSTNNSLHSSYTNENSDIASSISGSTSTALNLSTTSATTSSTTPTTPSHRLEPPSGEMSSSIREKVNWNPINMAQSYINPVTGKKRVQCTVCLKTFCDKGALKIHFSAVHLREMHKCTVEGCTMMFSSRRSRNRHSANPSPKLHTPHIRRKMSPHDGRSALSTSPLLAGFRPPSYQMRPGFPPLGAFPPPFGAINPLTGLPFIPPPSADDMNRNRLDMHHRSLEMQYGMGKHPLDLAKDQSRHLDNAGISSKMSNYYIENNFDDHNRMDVEGAGEDLDDSMSVDTQSLRGDASSPSSSKRKRKNQNPTKFAFRLEDDDLISTDDEYDDDDIDAKDSDEDKNIDKELDAMSDCDDEDTRGEQKDVNTNCDKSKHDGSNANVTSSSNDEAVDTSSALQHLENLSKNHFPGSLLANTTDSFDQQNPPASSPTPSDHDSDRESITALENEDNFHVGSDGLISNTNIPFDKENPRQCVACGKIFQNHFTVKIHYQNVHLKLMHTCTVTGCNAAFPSKRSRDRHASNLTLHRKLLSTSTTTSHPGFPGLGFPGLPLNPMFNPELLARLYSDPSALQFNSSNPTLGANTGDPPPVAHPPPHLFFQNLLPHLAANNNFQNMGMQDRQGNTSPQSTTQSISNQNLPRSQSPPQNQASDKPSIEEGEQRASVQSSPVREGEDQIEWQYNLEDDLPSPDRDGNIPCKFCMKPFGDGVELKNHYDEVHRGDLFKCTVSGCNKLFSSRRKRNNHAINSELHRHIESEQGREPEHCQTDRSTPEESKLI